MTKKYKNELPLVKIFGETLYKMIEKRINIGKYTLKYFFEK
tara:strand:+ start:264 stop:386 length:123 start_codon:yes stop_codon:yes gene_type:complete